MGMPGLLCKSTVPRALKAIDLFIIFIHLKLKGIFECSILPLALYTLCDNFI